MGKKNYLPPIKIIIPADNTDFSQSQLANNNKQLIEN